MSTLYDTEDGRDMLDLVDKLRNIDKIEKTIPLPQIVVVGQQSSGKSSVLNAISGIQFPIHDGLCTQFPTEIILRREQGVRTKASIRCTPGISHQRRSDIESFERKWQESQLSDLKEIISDAKKVLQLNDRNRFSAESLVLEISGPDQEHLTLIDLPGFIASTQTGQSSSDITLVYDIAERYISNDRAVVLAVISGRTDFENQRIFEYLKRDSDFRARTLGVITAPDAIDPGSRLEQNCVQLIQDDPRNLGYKWHVLRNLNIGEVKAGTFDRDAIEAQFFQQTRPWNRLDPALVGSQALKKRLSSILKTKIAESLPEIQKEVDLKLEQISAQLIALGGARQSPGEIRSYLSQRASQFKAKAGNMLSGSPPSSIRWLFNQTPSLRAYVQSKHQHFAQVMFDKVQTWNLDVNGTDTPERLRKIWSGIADGTAVISPIVLAKMFEEEISQNRDMALPGMLQPDWASVMFQRRSLRWRAVAKAHGEDIYGEMSKRICEVVAILFEEDVADRLLQEIVEPALRERKRVLDEKLEEIQYPYEQKSIYCVSRRYGETVNSMTVADDANKCEFVNCCRMLAGAEAFYKVAVDVFTENVIALGIERCLLANLHGILDCNMFNNMTDKELEHLGSESVETRQRRTQLQAEKAQFEEARDHVLPAFNRHRARSMRRPQPPQQTTPVVDSVHKIPNAEKPYSVEITAATPPITPGRILDDKEIPVVVGSSILGTTPRSRTSSPDYGVTSSSSVGSQSSGRHSRSVSSASSNNGSPTQPAKEVRLSSWNGLPRAPASGGNRTWFENAAIETARRKSESVLPATSQDDEEL